MAPSSTINPMANYEARKASFLQVDMAHSGSNRKKAASSVKLSWPYPIPKRDKTAHQDTSSDDGSNFTNLGSNEYPSPRSMANLGLFFDPTLEEPDRCSIYPEGVAISQWKAGQTALERLKEEDISISWVILERSRLIGRSCEAHEDGKVTWPADHSQFFPTGKYVNEARYKTYGGSWPLDGKKGWKPTSKKLSSAGFHYSPNEDEEDCVTCAYCRCSLGGWEKGDDPVKEHQKRRPECVVFSSVLEKEASKEETRTTRKANTSLAKGKTATSRKRAAEDKEIDVIDETNVQTVEKRNTNRTNHAQSQLRSPEEEIEEEVKERKEQEEVVLKAAPVDKKKAAPKAKKAASRKKVVRPAEEEEDNDKEDTRAVKRSKKTKGPTAISKTAELSSSGNKENEPVAEEVDNVYASEFEDDPTHSYGPPSNATSTLIRKLENVKMRESETFKTPKQTMSSRTTAIEKTPKASSPIRKSQTKPIDEAIAVGDIQLLTELGSISNEEKALTVEEFLKVQVTKACSDMQVEGQKRIAKLQTRMDQVRKQAECILRGIDVDSTV